MKVLFLLQIQAALYYKNWRTVPILVSFGNILFNEVIRQFIQVTETYPIISYYIKSRLFSA